MEQKGQRSLAFRLKERTGDGEVTATHCGFSQKGRRDLEGCFKVIRTTAKALIKRSFLATI